MNKKEKANGSSEKKITLRKLDFTQSISKENKKKNIILKNIWIRDDLY